LFDVIFILFKNEVENAYSSDMKTKIENVKIEITNTLRRDLAELVISTVNNTSDMMFINHFGMEYDIYKCKIDNALNSAIGKQVSNYLEVKVASISKDESFIDSIVDRINRKQLIS
jgi:hypothetical protein